MIMVLFSSLVSLRICLVHDMIPGPLEVFRKWKHRHCFWNGTGRGGALLGVQCSPLTALFLSLWGLLERLQQWKSATEHGQPCETTVSPSASMGRGSGDASMAFKQQEPWPLAAGLSSIGWHYRGHGRARVVITKGQFRGNSPSFLRFQ